MPKERIDKLLSHEGFGSRKDIKKLLRTSEVTLNGKRIFDPGTGADISSDIIMIGGETVEFRGDITIMMNKIMHTVSSSRDGMHRTVFDLLDGTMRTPYLQEKLHLVGRLDMDTEGLLLLTTDGTLTHRLISPKSHVAKTYFVLLEKDECAQRKDEIAEIFRKGISVAADDNDPPFVCGPAEISWPDTAAAAEFLLNTSWNQEISGTPALLTIYEGKYHQVKRMFAAAGNRVIYLKRISIGKLELDKKLPPGGYRKLGGDELELLF